MLLVMLVSITSVAAHTTSAAPHSYAPHAYCRRRLTRTLPTPIAGGGLGEPASVPPAGGAGAARPAKHPQRKPQSHSIKSSDQPKRSQRKQRAKRDSENQRACTPARR